MEIIQTYESTILAKETQHAAHVLVVPRRSLPNIHSDLKNETLLKQLSLKEIREVKPAELEDGLAVLLSPLISEQGRIKHLNNVFSKQMSSEPFDYQDRKFGEEMAYNRMIPFENSPLELEALSKIVLQATGAGIGAYAGFVIAGPTPLLFITAPIGMIIFGSAKGVADALEQGLRERLLTYLRRGVNEGEEAQVEKN